MMDRITDRDLEAVVARINKVTGSPERPYTNKPKRGFLAQIGNYHIDSAYGGVTLHRMSTEGGGVSDVLSCGFTTKRDLYNQMQAFLKGLDAAKAVTV